ncbi:TetR/AcrR family transcriptional regulator [Kitasatospora sp. NPDC004240]
MRDSTNPSPAGPEQAPGPLRDRLIDAGVELVLAEGVAALGLREIARRAGVSHGAPRRYFPTHQDLLAAIAHRGFDDLAGRVAATLGEADEAPSAPGPRERLRTVGRVYVRYALEQRGMFELMFRHELIDSERHPTDRTPLRRSTLPLFRAMVTLVGESGAAEPEVAAAALWANLHGLAQLWAWDTLPLALGSGSGPGPELDRLVTAVLDTHLGPDAG